MKGNFQKTISDEGKFFEGDFWWREIFRRRFLMKGNIYETTPDEGKFLEDDF